MLMRPLSAHELLDVWERALGSAPFEQALAILSAASPGVSRESLAHLSLGRRDAGLVRLREWAFGPQLPMLAACPRCHQQVELSLPIANLNASTPRSEQTEVTLEVEEYTLCCRSPNSEDLAACQGLDGDALGQTLFSRCLIGSWHREHPITIDRLPGHVVQAMTERMAQSDPQAELHIDFTCPACAHHWAELFDIVSFFWTEIDAWARRILREVHVLACRYGWTESDILSLSPTRRQVYLAMAQA